MSKTVHNFLFAINIKNTVSCMDGTVVLQSVNPNLPLSYSFLASYKSFFLHFRWKFFAFSLHEVYIISYEAQLSVQNHNAFKILNVSSSLDSWQSSIKRKYFILIQGQYCAVFEEGLGRVIVDLYTSCPECPMIYSSAESWNCKTLLYILDHSSGRFVFFLILHLKATKDFWYQKYLIHW